MAFTIEDMHPHDVAEALSRHGICIRAGHHCAEPLHILFKIPASIRISVGIYNCREDIDALIEVLSNIENEVNGINKNEEDKIFKKPSVNNHYSYVREGYNPSCGDEIKVYIDTDDGIITEVSYEGSICQTSQASANKMIKMIKGKSIEEAKRLVETVQEFSEDNVRRKCVLLPWSVLRSM